MSTAYSSCVDLPMFTHTCGTHALCIMNECLSPLSHSALPFLVVYETLLLQCGRVPSPFRENLIHTICVHTVCLIASIWLRLNYIMAVVYSTHCLYKCTHCYTNHHSKIAQLVAQRNLEIAQIPKMRGTYTCRTSSLCGTPWHTRNYVPV